MKAAFALLVLLIVSAGVAAQAQTDRQAVEEMERRASLVCSGYSVERGNPGIQG